MTDITIPKTQKVAMVKTAGATVEIVEDYPVKSQEELAPGECLLKMEASGCCHSDLHAAMGDWPIKAMMPLIAGHEGVGTVVAIGNNTSNSPVKIGDRVGVKFIANSCLNCENCRKGKEQNCLSQEHRKMSGFTVDGTFAEYVVSYVNHVTHIPSNLPSADAASLLCAGVTTYSAIKNSRTNPGDWIVIPGSGGGLGHLAVQYARVRGLRVIAIDTGEEKEKLSRELGADVWIDFKKSESITKDVLKATNGLGAHAAIITASASAAYAQAVYYIRPTGTLVAVGLPSNANFDANIFVTVVKNITIVGSYVGNRQEAIEAMDLAGRGLVKVHFTKKPLSELKNTYEDMKEGKIVGRVVFDL